jgi:2-oxo-3-hexenedioate decarboxylase
MPPRDDAAMTLAAELDAARRSGGTIPSRRGTADALSLDRAYELGGELERGRVSSGWRPAGWKLGFTNQALWQRLGLDRPIRARIYEQTLCAGDLDSAGLVDPRIEPEIVVGFGAGVAQGSGAAAIAGAIEWVAAGLEVVHCHFTRWELTPAEALADGGLHAALAIGPRRQVDADAVHGLSEASCELMRDGALVETGRGADVLGGPLEALEWLLRELPGGVRAGEIVTTGTLTRAVPIAPGERWEHRLATGIGVAPVTLRVPDQA